jgi:hypothetical protein
LKTILFFIRLKIDMKKISTIAVALLLLLSGMHITIATHFCGGELAATRVSVTGIVASCGMVHDEISNTSAETSFKSNCCENESDVYAVDEDYSTSEFHFKKIAQVILQIFYVPKGFLYHSNILQYTFLANASPPISIMANAVSMADICVFRI